MKLDTLINTIEQDIKNEKLGKSGNKFLTINEIVEKYNVAYVTALRAIKLLKNDNFVMSIGNINYITSGLASNNSDLMKKIHKNQNKFVGIHTRYLANPFFSSIIEKISKQLLAVGLTPIITSSSNDIDNEISIMKKFIDNQCLGVISFSGKESDKIEQFYSHFPLPLVLIGKKLNNISASYILTDNFRSGIKAAEYLIDQGYKKFFYINTPYSNSMHINSRLEGFKKGLKDNNIDLKDEDILTYDFDDLKTVNWVTAILSKHSKEKLGIFCCHDLVASSVLTILDKLKISVPEQAGLIGYDNLDIAQYLSITTFAYSFDNIATSAISFLFDTIKGVKFNQTYTIQTALFIRKSTTLIKN